MRLALAVASVVALAGSCSGSVDHRGLGPSVDQTQLARLKAARGLPIYWLGPSFEGLLLTHVESGGPGRAFLVYGDCRIEDPDGPFGPEGGSCAPPLEIQHLPNPFLGGHYIASTSCTRLRVHGRLAAVSDGLSIFTGRRIVKIYARTKAEQLRAARALRPINRTSTIWERSPPEMSRVLSSCRSS
jgi:hypothetical protein